MGGGVDSLLGVGGVGGFGVSFTSGFAGVGGVGGGLGGVVGGVGVVGFSGLGRGRLNTVLIAVSGGFLTYADSAFIYVSTNLLHLSRSPLHFPLTAIITSWLGRISSVISKLKEVELPVTTILFSSIHLPVIGRVINS